MVDKQKAQELAEYFKKNPKEIINLYKSLKSQAGLVKWVQKSNQEWKEKKVDQKSKKQVEGWFKSTQNYIFELMETQSTAKRKSLNRQIIRICKQNNLKKILDFGCGVGQNAIDAAKSNLTVTMADLPSKTLDFALWRAKRQKLNIKVIKITSEKPLKKKYDAILTLEVFQHLFNVKKTATHLFDHLNKKGFLFSTTRFKNPTYLMALKSNYHLEKTFDQELKKIGFIQKHKIYQWGNGQKSKYLYVFQKP